MASQYVTEPPTSGLVTLTTSKGPIDIELFSRETPLACRNFLTLALEGYYDNLLFHRLLPGFIIQSGDPSGTGNCGESIYGKPFAIEPHSRLKFNRRGLLAMAAQDKQNESQFFLTLDATPELQAKHTLMGRVVGKTIYNLLELAEGVELDGDRPRYPPKLLEIKVLQNPFDDLRPRMTKDQRREIERKERQEGRKRNEDEQSRKKGKGKKNIKLLSFGDEEEGEAVEGVVLKGPKSSHDLLKDDRKLSKQAIDVEKERKKQDQAKVTCSVNTSTLQQPQSHLPQTTKEKNLKKQDTLSPLNINHTQPNRNTSSAAAARSLLSEQGRKYLNAKARTCTKTDDSLSALLSFQSRLRTAASSCNTPLTKQPRNQDAEAEEVEKEYGSSDDDLDWQEHRLDAGGKPLLATKAHSSDDYEVLDPREHKPDTKRKHNQHVNRQAKRQRDRVDDHRHYSSTSSS
ncbi:Peptidyl-prolyl isomerase CWC27 [Ustilago sp. UG-2017a]|nr:Peptidyl-prolyl isomerase CWC27 [Ustilago sp. UG-2017a]